MHFNWTTIRYIYGNLLLLLSFFMAVATGVAVFYHFRCGETDWLAFLITTLITMTVGAVSILTARRHKTTLNSREGFLVVALAWVLFSLFGMLPYLLVGTCQTVADAFIETMAGFTTTGCTVLNNIEAQPHGILFWRCLTQWLGGLGIVVFSLSMLPMLGIGLTTMYKAEVSGLGVEKLRPKISATARRLWMLYLLFSLLCCGSYWLCGMTVFDAVCHTLSTMASGGFSTHSASIGYFQSPAIEYVCALFMILTTCNYSLYYMAGVGRFRHFWRNEEFRVYIFIILGATCLFMLLEGISRWDQCVLINPEQEAALGDGTLLTSFRTMLFHTASIISSSGFQAQYYDYQLWGPVFWVPTLMLMVMGGCTCSTAGGLKVVRFMVLGKNARNEFMQQIDPHTFTAVRINGHIISNDLIHRVMALLLAYIMLLVFSVFVLQLMGLSFDTAIGTAISAFGNTGPALGSTGPAFNWSGIPEIGKWYLSVCMLIGRLEIFTVMVLFLPMFWKK
ncbi:MAG: TrkH family potassium uptake protein [Bacteroidales bacterium]|nr:TrkH family potassium uptake protein [Bacteroidales bacterium]